MGECTCLRVCILHTVVVCDAKLNFDDNAEYRQESVFERRDRAQEDPREVMASEHDLNYIGLSGNIGCMGLCTPLLTYIYIFIYMRVCVCVCIVMRTNSAGLF